MFIIKEFVKYEGNRIKTSLGWKVSRPEEQSTYTLNRSITGLTSKFLGLFGILHGEYYKYSLVRDMGGKDDTNFSKHIKVHCEEEDKKKINEKWNYLSEIIPFRLGKKHGTSVSFSEDKKITGITSYHKNKMHGPQFYLEDGKIWRLEYWVSGKPHGWKYDFKKGKIVSNNYSKHEWEIDLDMTNKDPFIVERQKIKSISQQIDDILEKEN